MNKRVMAEDFMDSKVTFFVNNLSKNFDLKNSVTVHYLGF